ncbi:CRTAC1 family protein [Granulicella sp. L46]|uniref:CRTAC1 family protein n=1 Tax=Granulicella sp. L46 TaxID=1641865 RepID=UPI00131BF161|nr:CRTAC1 family protein [Granulicella sp. L46]
MPLKQNRHLHLYALCFFSLLTAGCEQKQSPPPDLAAHKTAAPTTVQSPTALAPQPVAMRPAGPVHFTDVSAAAGIHFIHNSGAFGKKYLPETMGSGVCVLDYDGDGWQDVFFVNSMDWPEHRTKRSTAALYHNNHDGTFTDVTRGSGLDIEIYGLGCAVGDFDNDGRDDIYITALDGNHLFRNLGRGKFKDMTASAGVSNFGFSTGAMWLDYDRDGKLDLLVLHYVEWSPATDQTCSLDGKHKSYCTPELYKGQSITLYRNKGQGVFEDVTKNAGLLDATSKSLGAVLLDYDDDGWPDFLVTNDTQPNKLYRNNHNGTFTESAFAAGVAFSDAGKPRAGMGADAADYDLNGQQSLVIGNFTNESMSLYHNDGGGLFTDQAIGSGIAAPSANSLTFSTFFFDYDLDGLPDIFALNGHVADDISQLQPSLHYAEPPLLFRNAGHGKFTDVSDKVGAAFHTPVVGRGAAYLDYDNDGDLDILLTTSNGPARLLRNDNGNADDMLRVQTIGTRSNRDGIGAKVAVKLPDGKRLVQIVKTGSSYLSQSELPLTFGLGAPKPGKVVDIEIVWPSGRRESIPAIAANQSIKVLEGKGLISAVPIVFSGTSQSLPH